VPYSLDSPVKPGNDGSIGFPVQPFDNTKLTSA
jgi:hypothetical protein